MATSPRTVSRRTVLSWMAGAGGLGVLAACAPPAPAPAKPADAPAAKAATAAPTAPVAAQVSAPTPPASGPTAQAAPAAPAAKPTEAAKPAVQAAPAPAAKPAAQIKRGGTIRLHRQNDWPSLDPHTAQASNIDMPLVYDYLTTVVRDPATDTWDVKPSLAESWDISDPTTVVFKLRRGVKFHDGTDFDAEAVKWNLTRMMTHPKSSAKNQTGTIDAVEVVDAHTVRLKLKAPSPSLFVNLSSDSSNVAGMISPTWAQRVGDEVVAREAVGTGPFRFVDYQPSNQVTYKRFEGYWRQGADGQPLPYPDEAVVKYNQDWNVALVQLRSGELDLVWGFAGRDVPTIQSNPSLQYMPAPWAATMYQLCFNAKPGARLGGDAMKKVRQAINHAVDREAIAKALGAGIGEPNYYYLVPGHVGYSDKVARYEYNVEKAKQLLAEAGYASGLEVTMDFISRPEDTQNAQLYQQMLAQVGIKANLQPSERIAWVQKTLSGDYEFGTFQSPVRPEPDFLLSNILAENAPANYMNWTDGEVQRLLREARTTYDVSRRQDFYEQAQNRIAEEAYVGFVWRRSGALAASKALQNVAPGWTTFISNSTEMWLDR